MKKPPGNIQDVFYRNLYENYEELSGFLRSAMDSHDQYVEEMRYLYDFIHYKGMDVDGHTLYWGLIKARIIHIGEGNNSLSFALFLESQHLISSWQETISPSQEMK